MRAVGADISKYQVSFKPVGNLDFIIQRASYGLTKDEKFNVLLEGVRQIERRGAYHYFSTELDPVEQAEFFFRTQGGQGFKWLAVDYERTNNVLDGEGEAKLAEFWTYLHNLTDKPIVLYTSPYTYKDNIIAYNYRWELSPLWMAHYNIQDPQTGKPEIFSGDGWLFWQYTNEGNGAEYGVGSDDVCLDVFNGTVEELDAWLGIEEEDCCEELRKDIDVIYNSLDALWTLATESDVGIRVEANANKIELNGIDLDQQAGEIEKLFEQLGILRAKEIAHTREHEEEITELREDVDYCATKANSNFDEICDLDKEIADLRQVCQTLSDEVANNHDSIADLQEDIKQHEGELNSCADDMNKLEEQIDNITIPITNHTHWYQRLWRKLFG